jgi:hypothetical protein
VLSPVPNIKGATGAARWVDDVLGIPVTARYITHQTNARALSCAVIAGARYYSTRALYDFIMSKTRPTTGVTA